MTSEVLLSNTVPFAGSGICGFAMGYAVRKILKWILIIVGFIGGAFLVGIQLMQKNGYINGTVNWDKLGNDTSSQVQHLAGSVNLTDAHGLLHTLGIPISSGLAVGFLAGFLRTH
jgi:uncharacterized membrane protein (Fun14 family)